MHAEGYLKAGDLTAAQRTAIGEPEYYWTWQSQHGMAEVHFYDEARVASPTYRGKPAQRLIGASEASKPPYLTKTLLAKYGEPAQVVLTTNRGENILYRPDILAQLSNPEITKIKERRANKSAKVKSQRREAAGAKIKASLQGQWAQGQDKSTYARLKQLAAPNFILLPETQFNKGDFRFGVAFSSIEHLEIVRDVCDHIGVPLSTFGNTGKWTYIAKDVDSLELLLEEANECLSNLNEYSGAGMEVAS